ncbi:MAG: ribonuclease III, partial [Planctomycetia bacterium]|nr:ribonuclease III [Planctomycetia bacterium]
PTPAKAPTPARRKSLPTGKRSSSTKRPGSGGKSSTRFPEPMASLPSSTPEEASAAEDLASLSPVERLQRRIGYTFRDPGILRVALTHSSGASHRLESNERLEFLGDSILGEIVCVELFRRFPHADEGELTRMKSDVVSRETCSRLSEEISLGDAMVVGKAIAILAEMPASIPANAVEALIAAIAIDGGRRAVLNFVKKFFWKEIDRASHEAPMANAKSTLQQLSQHRYGCAPQYILLDEQGPAHHRAFEVAVQIGSHRFPSAWGASKKQTEQHAARNALEAIHQRDAMDEKRSEAPR